MTAALSAFWQFLKYPRLLKISADKQNLKKDFISLFVLDLVFAGLVIGTYYALLSLKLIKEYESADLFQWGFLVAMILGAVLAPILEECIFRWQLRKLKFSIYFVMLSLMIAMSWLTNNEYVKFFGYAILLVLAMTFHKVMNGLRGKQGSRAWRGYFIFLFYYTAILFGLIHLSNMKGITLADPSFLLYVSSQTFGALSMGYIRVKYGLLYSILFHASFNVVLIPIAWFFQIP